MIRKIDKHSDFIQLARLLNEAFATIAEEFGLTKENSPTNNAFITSDELYSQLSEAREFYSYEDKEKPIGFVVIEKSSKEPDTFYIEKLAVHPDCRHQGIGLLLMDFATKRISELNGKRISIGLINDNVILKNWYHIQGFREFEVKSFEHLPFDVCMMEKRIYEQNIRL